MMGPMDVQALFDKLRIDLADLGVAETLSLIHI